MQRHIMQLMTKLLPELHKKNLDYRVKKEKYKAAQKKRTNYE